MKWTSVRIRFGTAYVDEGLSWPVNQKLESWISPATNTEGGVVCYTSASLQEAIALVWLLLWGSSDVFCVRRDTLESLNSQVCFYTLKDVVKTSLSYL